MYIRHKKWAFDVLNCKENTADRDDNNDSLHLEQKNQDKKNS